ncbi:hypothetical protein BSKO_11540 [Bryopsis sp. KO-2023]|nr:hypothetical protein BSKO_11540 [Bryopsis sp. KO-2023]
MQIPDPTAVCQSCQAQQIPTTNGTPGAMKLKFLVFDAAEAKGFFQRVLGKSTKKVHNSVETMCVSLGEDGPHFNVVLDSDRRSTSASHSGELIIPAGQSEILIHLFEDDRCVAMGRLPIEVPGQVNPIFRPCLLEGGNTGGALVTPVPIIYHKDGNPAGTVILTLEDAQQQEVRGPAPAALSVILLAQLINGRAWLKECFKIAARKKFQRLQWSCGFEGMHPQTGGQNDDPEEAAKLEQYKKVETLITAVKNDLDNDVRIHESAVSPPGLNLPVLVAEVYCEELSGKLRGLLSQIPPEHPAVEAVDMVVSIGQLKEYLTRNKLLPSMKVDSYLNATEHYVKKWIASAEMQLVARCMSLEAGSAGNGMCHWGSPDGGKSENGLSPMIVEMIKLLEDRLGKFERIIACWHGLGPFLERAISSVVRAFLGAVSKQCGMVYVTPHHNEPGQHMNLLTSIGATGVASHRRSSSLHKGQNRNGNLWQYHTQIASRLHDESDVEGKKMKYLMETLEQMIGKLQAVLDSPVFASLVTGLWENLSEDIYIFIQNLSDGRDYSAVRRIYVARTMRKAADIWFQHILGSLHDVNGKEDLGQIHIHASLALLA